MPKGSTQYSVLRATGLRLAASTRPAMAKPPTTASAMQNGQPGKPNGLKNVLISGFDLWRRSLPAAAQRQVELNDGEQLTDLRLDLLLLGRIELLLGLQNFIVAGFAIQVTLGGQFDGFSQGHGR